MPRFWITPVAAAFLIVTGCTSTTAQKISYDEASEFENKLRARNNPPKKPSDSIFLQPVNKKEPCKIEYSNSVLNEPNFKSFWDGGCRNSYAFGLGRDIEVSDTRHRQTISYLDHEKDAVVIAGYDFITNQFAYGQYHRESNHFSGSQEQIIDDHYDFQVTFNFLKASPESQIVTFRSPLSPVVRYVKADPDVTFIYDDLSNMPIDLSGTVQALDTITGEESGVRILKYKNGHIVHQKVHKSIPVANIVIPNDYLQHINSMFKDHAMAEREARANAEKAQQLERQYLAKYCDKRYTIEGLGAAKSTMICDWRDQFSEKFNKAKAQAEAKFKDLKQEQEDKQRAELERQRQNTVARNQALSQIANSLQKIGDAAKPDPSLMQPVQLITPTFGLDRNAGPRHYMINTDNGFERATCTGSGAMRVCY